ncbi:unnamed protein product (mitochondrion) [Plasmodiophora brassicae]|uniref:protein-tyrosine-phosphatase n=1 Tax=Plasmodiophora brassicae TaxID=37360 RepID=A0A0G4IM50_PLABS|nr:hypothetical protein PBRA_004997 [Plasmodiophora brassicae]SPQ99265.1 unnamed protein product [Plasmodiophora brassicae]
MVVDPSLLWRASEIVPGALYLGGKHDAKQGTALRHYGIGLIINCAKECKPEEGRTVPTMNLELHDSVRQIITPHFESTFNAIQQARQRNVAVLVHCVSGVSRAPTICIAYLLMSSPDLSLKDALGFVRERRPIIRPNAGFLRQLMAYEVQARALPASTLALPKRAQRRLDGEDNDVCSALYDVTAAPGGDTAVIMGRIGAVGRSEGVRWDSVRIKSPGVVRCTCTIDQRTSTPDAVQELLRALPLVSDCCLLRFQPVALNK